MVKKTITISLDVDIYLQIQNLRASGKEINISFICNEALKSAVGWEEEEPKPSDELSDEMEEKQRDLAAIRIRLSQAKEKERKELEDELEKAKAMQETMKNSRVADFD